MSTLKLKVRKTKNVYPGRPSEMGYVARVVNNGTADYEDIIKSACKNTTVHKAEAKVVFELCMESVADMLKQGYIVDLGPVGRLYPSCSSSWHSDPDQMSLSEVKPTLYYRPGDDIAAAVKGATLVWAKADGEEGDDNSGDNGSNGGASGWGDPGDITE